MDTITEQIGCLHQVAEECRVGDAVSQGLHHLGDDAGLVQLAVVVKLKLVKEDTGVHYEMFQAVHL